MALIGPLVFLLLIGLIVAVLGVFRMQQVSRLAHEAARWASVHGEEWERYTRSRPVTAEDVFRQAMLPLAQGLNVAAPDARRELERRPESGSRHGAISVAPRGVLIGVHDHGHLPSTGVVLIFSLRSTNRHERREWAAACFAIGFRTLPLPRTTPAGPVNRHGPYECKDSSCERLTRFGESGGNRAAGRSW